MQRPDFVFAHDNFKRVLQAGVGERGEFGEILLEIGEAQMSRRPRRINSAS